MQFPNLFILGIANIVPKVSSLTCYKDEKKVVETVECRDSEVCARHPFVTGTSYAYGCQPKSWCNALRLLGSNNCVKPTSAKTVFGLDPTMTTEYQLATPKYDYLTACCCDDTNMCNIRAMDTAVQSGSRGHFSNLMRREAVLKMEEEAALSSSSIATPLLSITFLFSAAFIFHFISAL